MAQPLSDLEVTKIEKKLRMVRWTQILLVLTAMVSVGYYYVLASRTMDAVITGQPSNADIKRTILLELPLAAMSGNIDGKILQALKDDDLERANIYYKIVKADPVKFGVQPETIKKFKSAYQPVRRYWRMTKNCVMSMFTRDVSTGEGLACNAASDLFVLGDVADLTHQSINWSKGKPVDDVIVGLSLFGVGASAISALTANPAAAAGASVAKQVVKTGKKGHRFSRLIKPLVKKAVDIPLLKKTLAKLSFKEAKAALKQPAKFLRIGSTKQLTHMFGRVKNIKNGTSFTGAYRILKYVGTAGKLARAERLTKIFGKKTPALFHLFGPRIFKLMKVAKPIVRATKYGYKTVSMFWTSLLLLIPLFLELFARKILRPALRAYKRSLGKQLNPEWKPSRFLRTTSVVVPIISVVGIVGTLYFWQRDAAEVQRLSNPSQVAMSYLYEDVKLRLDQTGTKDLLREVAKKQGTHIADLEHFLVKDCNPDVLQELATREKCSRLMRRVIYSVPAKTLH